MAKKKIDPEECEGIKQYKETAKEVKDIRTLISTITENSGINKNNLKHMAEAFKTLAESNSLTHYKLFARTEKLNIGLGKIETAHDEHVKNSKQHENNKRHSATFLVSCVAIGISVVTVIILAKQAGLF